MAEYFHPERDGCDPVECLDARLQPYARKAVQIIRRFKELCIYDMQVKDPSRMLNACMYASPKGNERLRLLNFTITKSNLEIEFRMADYLPAEIAHPLPWRNKGTNRYASLNRIGEADITVWIKSYLANLHEDIHSGKLKRQGASILEGIIARYFAILYPNEKIARNRRILRSPRTGRLLELDIFLPVERIAVEVQGPYHKKDKVAENDRIKSELCREKDIALLSIDWERARQELFHPKRPITEVLGELQAMIKTARKSETRFHAY